MEILHAKGYGRHHGSGRIAVMEDAGCCVIHNLGAVVVSDDKRHIRGIVTGARCRPQLVDGPHFSTHRAYVMTSDVQTCRPRDWLSR